MLALLAWQVQRLGICFIRAGDTGECGAGHRHKRIDVTWKIRLWHKLGFVDASALFERETRANVELIIATNA
jgi:hypothetical protein